MFKIKFCHLIVTITILFVLTACTLPGFSTPTPFSFPTPDKTMTALFEPTQAAPATSAADGSSDGPSDAEKTAAALAPSDTPTPTGETPTATEEPTETVDPDDAYVGPAVRSGPSITADYMSKKPGIDGDLYEWQPPIQKVINYVVYGAGNHSGELDASGTVVAGWDENYLYLGVRVKDNKYVQENTGSQIYLGDSIEILFDRYVSADYHLQAMNDDDYQIGISPGKGGIVYSINGGKVASMSLVTSPTPTPVPPVPPGKPPQAYMWFPKAKAGKKTEIKIGALESGQGYQVEFKIPWSLLGVTNPSSGDHYGFAISFSDNDKAGKHQQTVVSNVPTRYYSDPTTWGDLYLK